MVSLSDSVVNSWIIVDPKEKNQVQDFD